MNEYPMTVWQAKESDPYEYGYMLARAQHPTANFQKTLRGEPDLERAELMAEGWNAYLEDREDEAFGERVSAR